MELSMEFYRCLARILLETPKTREIILQAIERGSEEYESEDTPSQAGQGD
jgi:hypothetical protein